MPVPKEALRYFRRRDLRPGFDYRDVWLQEHAHAFTVAKAMELDLLDDIRRGLDRALAQGKTLRQFTAELIPLLQGKGWWGRKEVVDPRTGRRVVAQLGSPRRLRTIYRANLRAARAAGTWERAQRTKKTHPYFLYELGPSKEHRDQHRAWAGTLLPVDDPWWDDHFPPNGWGCKCRVRQVSRTEAERLGGPTEAPPRNEVQSINRRTGEVQKHDEGIDPAWASNPGKHRGRDLAQYLNEKIERVDRDLARSTIRSVVACPILDAFHARPRGDIAAGVLPKDIQKKIGGRTPVVRLSDRVMRKQKGEHRSPKHRGHPELTLADYRLLPDIIESPDDHFDLPPMGGLSSKSLGRRRHLVKKIRGRFFVVVLGRNQSGTRIDVISFRKSRKNPNPHKR